MNNFYYENEAVWFCCLRLFASSNFSIAFGLEDPKDSTTTEQRPAVLRQRTLNFELVKK